MASLKGRCASFPVERAGMNHAQRLIDQSDTAFSEGAQACQVFSTRSSRIRWGAFATGSINVRISAGEKLKYAGMAPFIMSFALPSAALHSEQTSSRGNLDTKCSTVSAISPHPGGRSRVQRSPNNVRPRRPHSPAGDRDALPNWRAEYRDWKGGRVSTLLRRQTGQNQFCSTRAQF